MASVAIVGGGPAGKSAARVLVKAGLAVTIFDKERATGGLMRYGYPSYRMADAVSERDQRQLTELGVRFETGRTLGKDLDLDELTADYDAVILAIGAPHPNHLGIPGEDEPGVHAALPFLYAARLGQAPEIGQRVLVIGGGDTAMDCATTAKKLGAAEVLVAYRGLESAMRAQPHEIKRAVEAGVTFRYHAKPTSIRREAKLVVELGGNREAFDTVLVAIGQRPDESFIQQSGLVPSLDGSTNHPKIWLAGGAAYGSDRLSHAILQGRSVAESVKSALT